MPIPERLTAALADRYGIERELGAGGMATVYLAADLKHDRKVAIKVLKPELAAVLGAERFVQEIKTTAALSHPHILPLFDSGEAGGFLYYVMPYIEGETIRDKLNREGQFGIEDAVKVTTEVADALDYAHRRGVIHRDIKPENILLHDGRPMVMDFGIALAVSAAAGGRMTETGLSLGTPHYMSPEQATADKDISARSDVYSLASVLYEMLAGEPPHSGGTAQQIIMKIIAEPARLVTQLRKSVPSNVAAALGKALEKLPADRFDSARAFADALTDVHFHRGGAAAAAAPVSARARLRDPVFLGTAVIALAGMAFAVRELTRPAAPAPIVYRSVLPAGEDEQLADVNSGVVLSADGSRLAYLVQGPEGRHWVVKDAGAQRSRPLTFSATAFSPSFSPDGGQVAFIADGRLMTASLESGTEATLADSVGATGAIVAPAWLDDGTIVYRSGTALWQVPAAGGVPRMVLAENTASLRVSPLPGSRAVLVVMGTDGGWSLSVLHLESGKLTLLGRDMVAPAYVNSGHLVFLRNGDVYVQRFDLDRLALVGTAVLTLQGIRSSGAGGWLAVANNGTMVYRHGRRSGSGQQADMVWVDRTGRVTATDSSWRPEHMHANGNVGWDLSPEGARLAVGLTTAGNGDVWMKQLPAGPATRVTQDSASDFRPRWMPDGRSILFVSDRQPRGVYRRPADGTGRDELVVAGDVQEVVISRDEKWLLARTGGIGIGAGGRDIRFMRVGVDTTLSPLLTSQYDESQIALSPDARWLAYVSDEAENQSAVYVRPFPNVDSARVRVSRGSGLGPVWSPKGDELFYITEDRSFMAVPVQPRGGSLIGEPRELFTVPGELLVLPNVYRYTSFSVAPDGQRFLMARDGATSTAEPMVLVVNFQEELKRLVPNE